MAAKTDVFEDAEHIDDDLDNDFEDDDLEGSGDGAEGSKKKDDEGSGNDEDEDSRIVVEEEKSEEELALEAKRERRREERKHQREARRQRETMLRNEIAARDQLIENLNRRMQAIEQRGAGSEIQQIDNTINQLANAYVEARSMLEQAAETQNGKGVAEATERMQQIRIKAEQLAAAKNQMLQRQQVQQRETEVAVDPRLKNYANNWINENKWYKQGGTDEDSRTVTSIDNALAAEGWNPNSAEYWDELSKRVRKSLPHRFKNEYDESARRKSIVSGSSRSVSSKPQGAYQLSAERVAAMKELGVWDDPKKRAEMIAEYKRYDRENKVA